MTTTPTSLDPLLARRRPDLGPGFILRCAGVILARDVLVMVKELPVVLAQAVVAPFFILFVFGRLLATIGLTQPGYVAILLPGVVALQSFLTGVQDTAVPMVVELSETREIEDRLLAPVPIWLVGVEKIFFGAMRGMAAALVATLIGLLVLPDVRWSAAALPGVLGVLALGGVVSAGIGLAIGASVPTGQISIVLTMVALLLMFTGSTTFPLLGLAAVRWFQVICAVNPLSYVSEGLRALLVPGLRSVPLGIDLAVLAATAVLVVVLGVRCFVRRVVD